MKLKITQKGAEGFTVGSTVEIDGDVIPPSLVNKCLVIDGGGKTMIVNPAPDATKAELVAQAEELGIEVAKSWTKDRIQEEIDAKLGE